MTNEPIHGRVLITHDNVEQIIEAAAKRKWTIEHIRDSITDNAEDFGDQTVLYTAVYPWNNTLANFNDTPYDPSYEPKNCPMMSAEEFVALIESAPEIP